MGREVNMDLDAAASAKADVPTGEAGVERREELIRDLIEFFAPDGTWSKMLLAGRRPLTTQVGTTEEAGQSAEVLNQHLSGKP